MKRAARLVVQLCVLLASASSGAADALTCDDAGDLLLPDRRAHTTPRERVDAARVRIACLDADRRRLRDAGVSGEVQVIEEQLALFASPLRKEDDDAVQFHGFNLSPAIGLASFSRPRIESAEIAADGTVRVTRSSRQQAFGMLEVHYYCLVSTLGCSGEGRSGNGPFFGVVLDEELISKFALGYMWGRRFDKSSAGLSVGIGAVLDTRFKELAGGYSEGHTAPTGETEVKFRETARWGWVVVLSAKFN